MTTGHRGRFTGEASLRIEAPAETIYDLVSDVTRMGEWSPECRRCEWLPGAPPGSVGARFRGHNRFRWMRWSRIVNVMVADRPREFRFETQPSILLRDRTRWCYRFAEREGGTVVTESFEILIRPTWYIRLLDRLAGREWRDHTPAMAITLDRLRAAAAALAPPGPGARDGSPER